LSCGGFTSSLNRQPNTTARIFNEDDGGGVEIVNTLSGTDTFCGVNSNGTSATTGDFVELYSKINSSGIGSRVYVTTNGIGLNANSVAPATIDASQAYLSSAGLTVGPITFNSNNVSSSSGVINVGCDEIINGNLIVNTNNSITTTHIISGGSYILLDGSTTCSGMFAAANICSQQSVTNPPNINFYSGANFAGNIAIGTSSTSYTLTLNGTQIGGSTTITHRTNIINYHDEQIGTFCESVGEIADVYGVDYIPTLDRATDAIVKVKQSTTLNSKIVGVITKNNEMSTHGDALCRVVDDIYAIGDILTVHDSGLMKKADDNDRLFMLLNAIPRPKITALFIDKTYVAVMLL
jgi:hypothetical protein